MVRRTLPHLVALFVTGVLLSCQEQDLVIPKANDPMVGKAPVIEIRPEDNVSVWYFSHPQIPGGRFRVMMPEVVGIMKPVRWESQDGGGH